MEKLFNLIFPPECAFCGAIKSVFCDYCLNLCKVLTKSLCVVCGKASDKGKTHEHCWIPGSPSQLMSVFEYSGLVRNCIRLSKYKKREFSTLKKLTERALHIVEYEIMEMLENGDFLVVPVPLHKITLRKRGFNQAEIIADLIGKKFSLKKEYSSLNRIKETQPMFGKSRIERFLNLESAFKVNKYLTKRISGKNILLVDDVCTSGATFLEASKALIESGAVDVKCFALSKKI